ncbi:MAG: D-alanine--D-alanine ligase family protein [Propionibacteriaceae bacterium]|nr:D-alanine--D-alanine ligase [Micropruina sp.]
MTNQTPAPVRVALIFGGVSPEHDVSCLTAGGVARAIDSARFEVVGIGITPSGRWVQVPVEEIKRFEVVDHRLPRLDEERPTALVMAGPEHTAQVATRTSDGFVDLHEFDVAFALLHGPFGEDGTIQGLFEMLGVRYVGSGVAASAIGMDKDLMKRSMAAAGLPVGPCVAITTQQWEHERQEVYDAIEALDYPLYVKPARGGSSLGITRVTDIADLRAAIEFAQTFDPKVIVEEGFGAVREIEVAVLGGHDRGLPRTSVPGEIVMDTEDKFYDYEAKYTPEEQVRLDVPAVLPERVASEVRRLAGLTFSVMGVEGLARIDTFVDADSHVWINELNTMPGFTTSSMFPKLWGATGLAYPELIADLIDQAMTRPMGLR